MHESYRNSAGKSTHSYTFSQKWGDDPFTGMGHAQIPAALFLYGARLGIDPDEGYLICCILHFKRTPSDEGPNQEKLAELFGRSSETVRRHLRVLEKKDLLVVTHLRGDLGYYTHSLYDWRKLRAALNECYWQDHPEERPQTEPNRTTPQKRGVVPTTPQKAPNYPSNPRGSFHRSEETTPQTCGGAHPYRRKEEYKESEESFPPPASQEKTDDERAIIKHGAAKIKAALDVARKGGGHGH